MRPQVDEYADYGTSESYKIPTAKETLRQKWLAGMTAAGKQHKFWWYWCVFALSVLLGERCLC